MRPESLNILLVDESEDDVALTRAVLEDIEGPRHVMHWVTSPRAALDAVACQQFDVLLIDDHLGAESGLDLLREMLRRGYTMPTILLTADAVALEAMPAGVADYLVKGQITGPLLDRALRYVRERSRAWAALREAEERHRALGEMISDYAYSFIVLPDGTRVLDWANDAYKRLGGRMLEDLRTPAGIARLIHPEDLPIVEQRARTLLAGESATSVFRVVTPGGEVRWLRDYARPIWDARQGRAVRIYGEAQDITATKQAEDRIRFQARLLEAVQQAVIATDAAGTITYWNAFAETLYGWPAAEVLGRDIVEVLPSQLSAEQAAAIMARLAAGESRSQELVLQRRDGSSFPAHVTASPIYDEQGATIGIAGISFDMTERKRAEQATERARLAAEELARVRQEQAEEAEALSRVSIALSSSLEPSRLYQLILDQAASVLPCETACVFLLQDGWAVLAAGRGEPSPAVGTRAFPMPDGDLRHWPGAGDPPLYRPDMRLVAGHVPREPWVGEHEVRSIITVPLALDGELLGVFDLASTYPRAYGERQVRLAGLFGERLTQALRNARLYAAEQAARARAERAEAHLQAVISASPLPLITLDPGGLVRSWNPAAQRMFGWEAAEVLGASIPMVTEEVRPEFDALLERVLRGEALEAVEVRRRRRDGSRIDLQAASAPLRGPDGDVLGVVAVYADITARRRAEEALAAERDLLHALMDHIPDLIYFKDRGSRFTRINRAQAAHLGATVEEATSKTDFDYYPPALAADLHAAEQAIMETGRPLINQLEDVSGLAHRPRWLLSTKVPLTRDGEITGLVGITRDITEIHLAEQRARDAERFSRGTLDALDEQIAILDADGTVLAVNAAWRRFARENGWHDAEPGIGSNYLAICDAAREETARQVAAGIRAVMAGRLDSYTQEYPCHAPDRQRWFALRVTRFGDEPTRVVAAHLDITARVAAERDLREAHEDLEARVAARTAELAEANRAKSDFLSRMSHELRTPLNAILGFTQVLQLRDLGERDNQALAYVLKAGRHLLALIDEVLDIARIDVGRLALSLEPVDLGLSVREVLQIAAPLAAQRGIALVDEVGAPRGPHVRADQQRLTQVLLNLVSNAIKYNRAGGTVTLRCDAREGGRLRLLVRDTGPGIAREDLDKLFRPFERLGAEGTEVEGTGIGLALCKRLMELMGGAIGVESEAGEGSTFWFALPAAEAPLYRRAAGQGAALAAAPAPGRRCTLLYIEDNASNLALIEHLVGEMEDVRLLTAMQGGLGLELACGQRPDLILLDLHLPDIAGEEVVRRLRADARTRAIPVAILSADAMPGTIERLRDAGVAAYLTKPVDVRQLLRFLHDALAQEGSRQHGT